MFRATPRSTHRAMDDPLRFSRLDTAQNLDTYYTDTGPSAHKLPPDEVARYEGNPPSVVGRKFAPGNGDDLWEITERAESADGARRLFCAAEERHGERVR
ncbi:hypothetical protein HYPSUDRAFT_1031619 [Hypholoma sublateritium FD-334 SS-4]|uniref:Uncharacterized protein n=1 Tax=Hypholoma sublateritium (strain FD-334 SS-4) TaxID=945553 RepID=A0A0D2PE18_HYPSF|nr:hypothetical protein HYPSUDRAFT_1031619 [Hypholoma sublateritium FD-334 SS-4]